MTLRGEGYRIDGIRGSKIRDDVLHGGRACRNNIFVSLSRLARKVQRTSKGMEGGKGRLCKFSPFVFVTSGRLSLPPAVTNEDAKNNYIILIDGFGNVLFVIIVLLEQTTKCLLIKKANEN